jgi:hypothetical protein
LPLNILHKYTPPKKLAIVTLFIIAVACADEKVASRSYPVVNTYAVTDINEQGATFNGEILDLSDGVVNHGFIYASNYIYSADALYLDSVSLGSASKAEKFSMLANRSMEKGKTYYVRAYAIGRSGKIVLGQELSFVSQGSVPPKITDFNPKEATVGDTILIVGTGFSRAATLNRVWFNDISALITKAASDSLQIIVPSNASLSNNMLYVDVGGQKAAAADKFNLLQMTATSFEPLLVTFGDTITVHGTNFPLKTASVNTAIFEAQAAVVSTTRTQIKAVLPMDVTVSSSKLTINVGVQSADLPGPIRLQTPVISSFSPVSGARNAIVTLTGKYFHPDKTKDIVTFAGRTLVVTEASRTALKVRLPDNVSPGFYPFTIKILDLTNTTAAQFELLN